VTPEAFKHSLAKDRPPVSGASALASLWWLKKGDWERAHAIVMDDDGRDAAWVHAHLHRVEDDQSNARYWYQKARKPVAVGALEDEWDAIVATLLAR